MRRSLALMVALNAGLCAAAVAADVAEDDVVLKVEIENWGEARGLTAVAHEQARRGVAMAMAADAAAVGGLNLPAGEYTLVLWAHAPAGDADGFFVEINGDRTRLLGPIGSWGTLALPFTVAREGPVTIAIIGQEAGMTVDQIAVVRGSYPQGQIEFAQVPGEPQGESIGLDDIERLSTPCALASVPDAAFAPDEQTVFHQSFDAPCAGVVGEHRWGEGRWGQGLILDMPDGRFDIDAAALEIGEQGTIEWWVKTREAARIWWDQGWHYLLHAEPARPGGPQLDLSKYGTQLVLTLSLDGQPYVLEEGLHETVAAGTGGLSNEDWHHLLVSWDLSGERQWLWLMIDGVGTASFFPRGFEPSGFARIEIGNTPSDWDVPYLPLDGAIDELRIRRGSVADRLAQ
ncbi:MAG: LamG-like jellyroll fold domain-containing protein [Armatimonadota bacterium]